MTIVTAAGVVLALLASVYLLRVKHSSERRRARQQALLIGFSKVRSEQVDSPDAALKWLADALPAAWQYFGIACSRVTLDGRSLATPNFEETPWRQLAEIVVEGKVRGGVEMCYREPKAPAGEDPFLPEEYEVLNEVARDIGLFVRRLEAEDESRTARRIVEKSPVVLYRLRIEPSMPMTYVSRNISQYGYSVEEFLASPDFYRTLVHPDDQAKVRESQERVLAGTEVEAVEFRLRGRDGSWHWISNYLTAAHVEPGRPRDAEGTLVDITPIKLAAEEVRKRERILDAIVKVAAELLEAPALDVALPPALSQAGEAVGADRVSLLERRRAQEGRTSLSCIWNAPEVEPRLPEFLESHPDLIAAPEAFYASLTTRQILTVVPSRIEGDFATFLRTLNIQSLLLVPILIEAERWGHLAFDDCHTERIWTTAECDALRVLAEIIGASIVRERRTTELSDAQHIVDSSSTVLYCAAAEPDLPVTYVSPNVSGWGYRPEQFTTSPHFYQTLVHPDDQASVTKWLASLLRDGAAASSLEVRFRLGDGSYRAYNLHALRRIDFSHMTDDFHFDTEIIIKLHHQRYSIREVPIPTYYGSEICHVNGLQYAANVLRAVRRYRQTCRSAARHAEFQEYFVPYPLKAGRHSSHDYARQMTGSDREVLDVGCGQGFLAAELGRKGNRVTGIDCLPYGRHEASLQHYLQADLDRGRFARRLRGQRFDRILLLDVLEHLRYPERVLDECRELLRPGGAAVISLPNVANAAVRLALLFGQFNYTERGILDRSHLRFFTRKTARRFVAENGYEILEEKITVIPLDVALGLAPNGHVHRLLNFALAALTQLLPGLLGYQIVLLARPVQTRVS